MVVKRCQEGKQEAAQASPYAPSTMLTHSPLVAACQHSTANGRCTFVLDVCYVGKAMPWTRLKEPLNKALFKQFHAGWVGGQNIPF